MFWPVAVLAVLSLVGGWIQVARPLDTGRRTSSRCRRRRWWRRTTTQEVVSSVFAVVFGLVGIGVAWALYGARRAEVPRVPQVQAALERKLWFDELYDLAFYRPAVWLARALNRWIERPIILGSATELARRRAGVGRAGRAACRRAAAHVRARVRRRARRPRRRLHLGAMNDLDHDHPDLPARSRERSRASSSPVGGGRSASFAVLVSLVEVGFWIDAVRASTSRAACSSSSRRSWFSDLHVSYHVGMFGFSLWLVGLTVVVMTAAIAYAFVVGRDRSRAYYGLMLLLTGAIVGVFTAQDLLLFYVMFEAMLIPLYVLVGVWGGAGRLGATFKFVAYTMAGSLLMLVVDHRARALAGDVRPRRRRARARRTGSSSASRRRSR